MATFTISGTATLPDGVTPLEGTWTIGIESSNGVAFQPAGTNWSGGRYTENTIDGYLEIELPETDDTFLYWAQFLSHDYRKGRGFKLGPYIFELTANTTWQAIIDAPERNPVTPDALAQALAAADAAEAAAAQVVANRAAIEAAIAAAAFGGTFGLYLDTDAVPYFDFTPTTSDPSYALLLDTDSVPYFTAL